MELEEIKLARKMEIWEAQLPVICQQEHSKPSQWNTGFFTVKVIMGGVIMLLWWQQYPYWRMNS